MKYLIAIGLVVLSFGAFAVYTSMKPAAGEAAASAGVTAEAARNQQQSFEKIGQTLPRSSNYAPERQTDEQSIAGNAGPEHQGVKVSTPKDPYVDYDRIEKDEAAAETEPGTTENPDTKVKDQPSNQELLDDIAAKKTGDNQSLEQVQIAALQKAWNPMYEAAKEDRIRLETSVSETRKYWYIYMEEQTALAYNMASIPELGKAMRKDLNDDIDLFDEWNKKAETVLAEVSATMAKLDDMDRAIRFYKNRADLHEILNTKYLDVGPSITSLANNLDSFKQNTMLISESLRTE